MSRCLGAEDIIGFDRTRAFDPRIDEDPFAVLGGRARDGTTGHELPDRTRERVGEQIWGEYFKFTVVRNPWDLLVSFLYSKFGPDFWRDVWRTARKGPNAFAYNLPRALRLHRLRSEFRRGLWKECVDAILREGLFSNIREIPQFYFSRQEPYADGVIRYEALQPDYDKICHQLNLPQQRLPRTNSRQRPRGSDYRDYFTDYSERQVAELCSAMTAMFGYRFEDGVAIQRQDERRNRC